MKKTETATHGVICRMQNNTFGYFGWPTITKMDNGTLIAACSGFRLYHLCPFGKTVLFYSFDEGHNWTPPVLVNDSSLDDRDAGLLNLGGDKLLLSWFNLETWVYSGSNFKKLEESSYLKPYEKQMCSALVGNYSRELDINEAGSFVRVSKDAGITWGKAYRVPVSTPHGPCMLSDGRLFYLGRDYIHEDTKTELSAWISEDEGERWTKVGTFSLPKNTEWKNFCEPFAIQLSNGKILAHIRFQDYDRITPYNEFTIFQTLSDDNGKTWSTLKPLGVSGAPPHILIHSSGTLVCTYGRREKPYGQRAIVSTDQGKTWSEEVVLRDDGPDADLGYPSSVELADGSILTVYYQKFAPGEKCSLLWTKWKLPLQL